MRQLVRVGKLVSRVEAMYREYEYTRYLAIKSARARTRLGINKKYKTISFNLKPKFGSWGGGSQFVNVFSRYLSERGHNIVFNLCSSVDVVLLIEGVDSRSSSFFKQDLEQLMSRKPDLLVVHRVNECDSRKETDYVDNSLLHINSLANKTVFISQWLKEYHNWFSPEQHVITNSCDETIFFPGQPWNETGEFRLVTHHWSPNWNKGFRAYLEIDSAIASESLQNVSLTIIGRWPTECKWKTAKLIPPMSGRPLADELRRHHAYITASVCEPCGMHHVEGAACGLPVAYYRDGGGIVEMCSRYGVEFGDDPVEAVRVLKAQYDDLRRNVITHNYSLSSTSMCDAYAKVLELE